MTAMRRSRRWSRQGVVKGFVGEHRIAALLVEQRGRLGDWPTCQAV
jgi:hypothetical protein